MTLAERCESIRSREDFVAFVRALKNDLRENPGGWENPDLDRFLEALETWVQDMEGFYKNQGKQIPQHLDWKHVGDILMAAKMYE